jgi:hypothetical protein
MCYKDTSQTDVRSTTTSAYLRRQNALSLTVAAVNASSYGNSTFAPLSSGEESISGLGHTLGRMMACRQHLQLDFHCLGVAHLNLLVLHGWWWDFNSGYQLIIWEYGISNHPVGWDRQPYCRLGITVLVLRNVMLSQLDGVYTQLQ